MRVAVESVRAGIFKANALRRPLPLGSTARPRPAKRNNRTNRRGPKAVTPAHFRHTFSEVMAVREVGPTSKHTSVLRLREITLILREERAVEGHAPEQPNTTGGFVWDRDWAFRPLSLEPRGEVFCGEILGGEALMADYSLRTDSLSRVS